MKMEQKVFHDTKIEIYILLAYLIWKIFLILIRFSKFYFILFLKKPASYINNALVMLLLSIYNNLSKN